MKVQIIKILSLLLLTSATLFSQTSITTYKDKKSETYTFDTQRSIELNENSIAEDISISVSKDQLELSVNGNVKDGKLTIEIYDATNINQGQYTLETQLTTEESESVKGRFEKTFYDVSPGQWKIKIIPESVQAKVQIMTRQ